MTSQIPVEIGVSELPIAIRPIPLHAVSSQTPVPHWVVLIVAVLGLWVVIAGGVMAIDGLFDRLSWVK
ncbi:hypothetical protein [Haladaptatus sp. DYF46]|uniref:hypothetical protein n=1 Tax=Haladaptatus sp. DYF46 TaxID=2886041 RepID=UPI001E5DFCED|nr:hypothetical protein [Haladaptatus sp. DYF46]